MIKQEIMNKNNQGMRNIQNNPNKIEDKSIQKLYLDFNSNPDSGLYPSQVQELRTKFGYNEIPETKENPVIRFLRKFWGPTAWILEFIIILSAVLQKTEEFYMVLGLLFMNVILSFYQEEKAAKAVNTLKQRLQINAKVMRERKWIEVPARELVPGDIIRVRTGDFIPADLKIIAGDIDVDQSALTGESLDLEKHAEDGVFQGSIIRRGEATGIIIQTGIHTNFGRTTQLIQIAHPKMALEKIVSKVVRWLMIIVSILLGIVVIVSIIRGGSLFDILPLVLVLLLSAIPVALPVMFTVTVSLSSQKLSNQGVLVTRLNAAEDAATMTVLCSDKTGTLTKNQLSIIEVKSWKNFTADSVILYGALAAQAANHDPIDDSFIQSALNHNLINESYHQIAFSPFNAKNRRTEATIEYLHQQFVIMKGAVNTITELCHLPQEEMVQLNFQLSQWAKKGYRTLAVAVQNPNSSLQLVGITALYDSPRADSKDSIRALNELGISVKMLTGDSEIIAKEVAQQVGLGGNIKKTSSIKELLQQDPKTADLAISESDGFAEIYPEDKYMIVKQLQKTGHIVGMTGDGVNDAPALHQAEVGIAVNNATDVAKSAASVVLINDGLSGTIELVKEGRMVYQRIITWILSKLVRNIFNNALIVLFFILSGKYIASAFGMILILFLTDFVKIAIATDNVEGSPKPNSWNISSYVKNGIILGILILIELSFLLYLGFQYFNFASENEILQSFTFGAILYADIFSFLNVREKRYFWKSHPSKVLLYGLFLDFVIGTLILIIGIPGLKALPINLVILEILFILLTMLGINEWIKVHILYRDQTRIQNT